MSVPRPSMAGDGAVLLLSGGLDSTVLLAALRGAGWAVDALTVAYGQRHAGETSSAAFQASLWGCASHTVVEIPSLLFEGSSLTRPGMAVPAGRTPEQMASGPVPSTYVPARNLVFLALATARAESAGSRDVFIAVNAMDCSGYPDCRPSFVEAFGKAATLGTREGISVHAPLGSMTKAQIVSLGASLGVDFSRTLSCYDPDGQGRACGRCDSCILRARGFEQAGVPDSTRYAKDVPC